MGRMILCDRCKADITNNYDWTELTETNIDHIKNPPQYCLCQDCMKKFTGDFMEADPSEDTGEGK